MLVGNSNEKDIELLLFFWTRLFFEKNGKMGQLWTLSENEQGCLVF
jgi:hypothetical protein